MSLRQPDLALRKEWCLTTNMGELASFFSFRCPGTSSLHGHSVVQDIECEHTGRYTLAIAMLFHLAIARQVLGKWDLKPVNVYVCAGLSSPRVSEASEDSEPDRLHVTVRRSHHRLAITNNI